jgi:hypothetical protein
MQYRRHLIIFCSVFFSAFKLFAQSSPEVDITGLWKGTMYNDTTQQFLKYEIGISQNEKGKFSGFTHTYFILEDKEYHGVKKVKIKRQDGKIIVEDAELIVHNYPVSPAKGVRQLNVLTLDIHDSVMILSGPFSTNQTREYSSLTGYINVQRKNDFRQSALIPHLEELGLAKNLSFVQQEKIAEAKPAIKTETFATLPVTKTEEVTPEKPIVKTQAVTQQTVVKAEPVKKVQTVKEPEKPIVKTQAATQQPVVKTETVKAQQSTKEPVTKEPETGIVKKEDPKTTAPVTIQSAVDVDKRTIETIQAVYYKSDSLVLTLYDNGEVDGDTVSVLMNGKLIMPRVGLSTNAVRKTIYTKDIEDSIQIIMYAETLGSLPPNTGLLIVNDGTDRYEIRFSGDMEKSSAIMFRRKGPL